jgi:glyoxylase-like metal-dependent hydrolase (beta-lactamase superfamily II)
MTKVTKPEIKAYFDAATNTISYLVSDPDTGNAAIIDPVLDYDHKSGRLGATSAQRILGEAGKRGLKILWVLETHAQADHLTAASYIRSRTGARVAIGEHICSVQRVFRVLFNDGEASRDGTEFDRLLKDGDRIELGSCAFEVLHTPGHTPACVSYRIADAVFVGDTIFMPDFGTARTDFPGGDAATLYRSIQRLLDLPPQTRFFMCHDYKAPARDQYAWETTVADEKRENIHVHDGVAESEFVAMRRSRDGTLQLPTLLMPSVQVNIRAGRLPSPESNGSRYLKIPLNLAEDLGSAIF